MGRLSQSLLPTAQVGQVGGWRAPPPFALIVSTAGLCGARAATRRAARAIAAQSLPSSAARCQLPVGKLAAPANMRVSGGAAAPANMRVSGGAAGMKWSGISPNFKTSNGALKLRFRPRRGARWKARVPYLSRERAPGGIIADPREVAPSSDRPARSFGVGGACGRPPLERGGGPISPRNEPARDLRHIYASSGSAN